MKTLSVCSAVTLGRDPSRLGTDKSETITATNYSFKVQMTYESLRCEKSKPAFLRLAGGRYEFNSCLDVEKFKEKNCTGCKQEIHYNGTVVARPLKSCRFESIKSALCEKLAVRKLSLERII